MSLNLEDKKSIIISELETMIRKETVAKNFFKVRAYRKVVDQLLLLPSITSFVDLRGVTGIGPKISQKIEEILVTGKLAAAQRVRQDINVKSYEELLKIHGIGVTKAQELVQRGITTVEQLKQTVKTNPDILNEKQKIGLEYHTETQLRIPREEMDKHLRKLTRLIKTISKSIEVKMVGSYRRGEATSGDIDVILMINKNSTLESRVLLFKTVTEKLKKVGYLIADLGSGNKKYMGICKLNKNEKARRIDILMTSVDEYPYALLYFTGDFNINIELRKRANELGYTLSEHGIIPFKSGVEKPVLKTEKEIFNFLGYRFLFPKRRTIANLKRSE